jgi:hypothetical protein
MYQEVEMWKAYKKEKVEAEKLQHQHEVIGSVYALTYFGVLAIIASYLV